MIRVLIPSRTDEYLNDCLESLDASMPGSSSRVIVADNGISEGAKTYWRWKGVEFVDVPRDPFVFARAVNLAAARATPGQDLLVLNDDAEMVTPRWSEAAERALGKLALRRYGLVSFSISDRANVGNADQALDPGLPPGHPKESRLTLVFIAAVIRAEAWARVGPLDERFDGYGFDDNDYNVRVWKSGLRCGVISDVVVRHGKAGFPFSSSFARYNTAERLQDMWKINHAKIKEKWKQDEEEIGG